MAERGAGLAPFDGMQVPPVQFRESSSEQLVALRRKPSRAADRPVDVEGLARELARVLGDDARFDDGSRGLYAQDASNYFEVPLGVVRPRTRDDALRALEVCRRFAAPVVCRTGGTALAGQTCNRAVVFDFSRHMNHILSLDVAERSACVEPGVVCDDLVHLATPHGITWGPKPATHDRCCFGGMLANNCGGMEAQLAGIAVHNVEAMDVALYDGTVMSVGWMSEREFREASARPGREGEVYRRLRALRDRVAPLVKARFPQIPRRVSGYNLDQLIPDRDGRVNVARALVGSEGTCVVTLNATLRLVPIPPRDVLLAVGFKDIFSAADAIPTVLEYEPMICEGLDQRLIDSIKHKHIHQRYLPLLPKGCGWLLIKLGSETDTQARDHAQRLLEELKNTRRAIDGHIVERKADREGLWQLRESGLGATAFVPGQPDSWPGWEDSAVAPDKLGAYLRDVDQLFERYGYEPALYGHFGQGLLHCRVAFDLTTSRGIEHYKSFLREAADLCCGKYGGSLSGEHGDGQSRGWLLERMFGRELVDAFGEFKLIWDPDQKMNPGKVVFPNPVDRDLRLGPSYTPTEPATYFSFRDDNGSFARATLRCVGVGKCRRHSADGEAPNDVMCPSYMVTREEMHSTRGRAHLLWEMMRGGNSPIENTFRNEHVKEALDLCLACKGCKGDCPVNVDVATYKAEFLAHYYSGRLRPRQAYAFGFIDKWSRLAGLSPSLVNLLTHADATAWLAKLVAGIHPSREAPRFAKQSFLAWERRRTQRVVSDKRVVLWPDTFNNHFHPETAKAALRVLEGLGYEVLVPRTPVCCGRPLYDFGFLGQARSYLERVLEVMGPWLGQGHPVVVLEPSCASVFRDELMNLMPGRVDARRLQSQTKLLSELVSDHDDLPRLHRRAIVQGHCHHKSVLGFDAESKVHERMGLNAELLSSGCCGMAGSFGFERDEAKQHVASELGERVLYPAVRKAQPDTIILADGFSCRTQIAQGTGKRALHLAEALELAMDYGPEGPPAQALALDHGAGRREDAATARKLLVAGGVALLGYLLWRSVKQERVRIGASRDEAWRSSTLRQPGRSS